MRQYIYYIFLSICILFSQPLFAQSITNNSPDQSTANFDSSQNVANNNPDQIVQQYITAWMSQNQIPGVAVAIYYQGQDHYYNFGVADTSTNQPVTQNTIFELGSVSKSITATLLGICVEQGKCHLNDPVTKFLPALASNNNNAINQVTLQELATHTASFPRMSEDFGVADPTAANANTQLMSDLSQWQPSYPIGTQYQYSNIGFGLLGEAVSNALGTNYSDAISQYIFQPLNMSNSFVAVPADQMNHYAQGYNEQGDPAPHYQTSAWPGGGGVRSTSADMLQYLKANLGALNISPQLSAAMNLTEQGYFNVNPNFTQGLSWQLKNIQNLNVINKNGMNQGFNTYVAMVPQQKIAIVVLANKRGVNPNKIANQILRALA